MSKPLASSERILESLSDGVYVCDVDYPRTPFSMLALEEQLLKFSNAIRMPDDITIIAARSVGPD